MGPIVTGERLEPGDFCRYILQALDVSAARSRRRKRDQTPDGIGMSIKRDLLERGAAENPPPDEFEGWLLEQIIGHPAPGGARAMGAEILAEYQLAAADPTFREWLEAGAPSADGDGDVAPVELVGKVARNRRGED